MAIKKLAQVNEETSEVVNTPKAVLAFKVTKNVTLPLLKMVEEEPAFVKFTSAMFVGKEVKGSGDGKRMEPAVLAHCINLETGENVQIIINAVVKENLNESYPSDAYVGKCFQLVKHAKREGKRYNDFSVSEIEVD